MRIITLIGYATLAVVLSIGAAAQKMTNLPTSQFIFVIIAIQPASTQSWDLVPVAATPLQVPSALWVF